MMRYFLLGFLGVALVVWFIGDSSSFQNCVSDGENYNTYHSAKEGFPRLPVTVIYKTCVGKFINDNGSSITALSTIFIAIFTYTLFRATSGLLDAAEQQRADTRESLAIARQTADAATRQSKASVAVELPIVRIVDAKLIEVDENRQAVVGEGKDPVPSGNLPSKYNIVFLCRNSGRTIANVHRMAVDYAVTPNLPPIPNYDRGWHNLHRFDIEQMSEQWIRWWLNPVELSEAQQEMLVHNHLWIYGYLEFTDFMDEIHTSRFVGRWDSIIGARANGILFNFGGTEEYTKNT